MARSTTANSPRKGRPTREEARARHDMLLDTAIEHFLRRGYEQSTIEAIAADVSMTKRTIYARYSDKSELFLACVRRAIERQAVSAERIAATRSACLEQTLVNVAKLRIALVETPEGLRLQRIVNAESYRFPDVINTYYELAVRPTTQFLERELKTAVSAGELALDDIALAASLFISMVVSGPVRLIVSSNPLPADEVDKRISYSVKLFLDGARSR